MFGKSNPVEQLPGLLRKAVAHYWRTRQRQEVKQKKQGKSDQGARGAVTGGAQMDGFIDLFTSAMVVAGADRQSVFRDRALELPGYFRPTKEWDLLVVSGNRLVAALEAKSQVGPSFGNNFNNRTEEAMGTALDLWTAYREGAFAGSPPPFVGYFFMLEDCPRSQSPVKVQEPHFEVFAEFKAASYARRYELFCRKLVRERHYSASAFITSRPDSARGGAYIEPASDLNVEQFIRVLMAHVSVHFQERA